jgi:hypothetical protein
MKKAILALALTGALLIGCAPDAASPDPSDYDTDCRVNTYSEGLSMEEYNTFPDKVTDLIVEEDMSMEEALDELGVPYYEKCKTTGGE